jgi:hypothetical protein
MKKTLLQTFAAPSLLLAVTVAGLVAGVVADDWWDAMAVAALAVPLLAILASLLRRPG